MLNMQIWVCQMYQFDLMLKLPFGVLLFGIIMFELYRSMRYLHLIIDLSKLLTWSLSEQYFMFLMSFRNIFLHRMLQFFILCCMSDRILLEFRQKLMFKMCGQLFSLLEQHFLSQLLTRILLKPH